MLNMATAAHAFKEYVLPLARTETLFKSVDVATFGLARLYCWSVQGASVMLAGEIARRILKSYLRVVPLRFEFLQPVQENNGPIYSNKVTKFFYDRFPNVTETADRIATPFTSLTKKQLIGGFAVSYLGVIGIEVLRQIKEEPKIYGVVLSSITHFHLGPNTILECAKKAIFG